MKRLNLAEGVWTDAKGDSRDLAVRDVDVPAVLLKSHLRLVSEPATDSIDVLWDFSRLGRADMSSGRSSPTIWST
ncbi:hypothetical protein [Streptosporangium sp. CA-115845]|uniref:hypothetical protein n=1 Tax=Streptosporangium sp. CA-115845 TaxID=3240071 RepID=UPI003D8E6A3E